MRNARRATQSDKPIDGWVITVPFGASSRGSGGVVTDSRVFLFSGHIIDQPSRATPRFPSDREGVATAEIGAALDRLGAVRTDLGLCSGAAGADLLFAEACLARHMHMEFRLPFREPAFLLTSVDPAGANWRQRYFAVTRHPNARVRSMPDELGPTPEGENPYVRCNEWMLAIALEYGRERAQVVVLWDGHMGTGAGGTSHLVTNAEQLGLKVTILDSQALFFGSSRR